MEHYDNYVTNKINISNVPKYVKSWVMYTKFVDINIDCAAPITQKYLYM